MKKVVCILIAVMLSQVSFGALVGQWLTPDPVTFNGVAEDVIDTGVVGPTGSGARTITAWVNLASGTTNDSIVSQGDSWLNGGGKRFTLKTNNTDNRLRVEIGGGYAISTSDVADGTWHHVAVTSAAGNTSCSNVTFYIDGVENAVASSLAGNINTEAASLLIGGIIPRNEQFLTGSLMDVQVYDSELDAAGIEFIYSNPGTPFTDTAFGPTPANGEPSAAIDAQLSWSAPSVYSATGYDVWFGTEPNTLNPNYDMEKIVSNQLVLTADPALHTDITTGDMAYATPYTWWVVAYEPNSLNPSGDPHTGETWSFTTRPEDLPPVVTAGNSYITWVDNLPQAIDGTVDDKGEGDILNEDVIWSIVSYPGDPVNATVRMVTRGTGYDGNLAELETAGYDPNLLVDWIGTDINNPGNPLTITLSGLPSGSYTWTSKHHDVGSYTGIFDVAVDGVVVATGVDISDSNEVPVTEFTTTIASDGSNPVQLVFDQKNITLDYSKFFVMNGVELTNGIDTLKIDFGADSNDFIATGYDAYKAINQTLDSFTAQDFSAFGTTVTVLPEWGPKAAGWITASVTKTSTDPLNPTADFITNYPGDYGIQLTATDSGLQSDSDQLVIRVRADTCEAAKITTGFQLNDYDVDGNCVVDLSDFAIFAAEWLDDIRLTDPVAY